MLQCIVVCYRVLQCVVARCNVLQCVAARCNVLQCVAVCCSVLQCDSTWEQMSRNTHIHGMCCSDLLHLCCIGVVVVLQLCYSAL